MNFIRKRVLKGELLFVAWCSLGSSITVEIAGRSGPDWILLDLEHGMGDYQSTLHQLQAADITSAAPIVRLVWNDAPLFKRMLDLGAVGIMVPWVSTVQEAQAMRGLRTGRSLSGMIRSIRYTTMPLLLSALSRVNTVSQSVPSWDTATLSMFRPAGNGPFRWPWL